MTPEQKASVALFGATSPALDRPTHRRWHPRELASVFGDRLVSYNEVVEYYRNETDHDVSCSHWGVFNAG